MHSPKVLIVRGCVRELSEILLVPVDEGDVDWMGKSFVPVFGDETQPAVAREEKEFEKETEQAAHRPIQQGFADSVKKPWRELHAFVCMDADLEEIDKSIVRPPHCQALCLTIR